MAELEKKCEGCSLRDKFSTATDPLDVKLTCNLSKINPFEYLTELQKNTSAIFKNPQQWLPWNYKENLVSSTS